MRKLAVLFSLMAGPALATGLQIEVAGEANGTVTIDLFEDVAPQHVERITALAEAGAYDGVVFHRVIEGFMAQTGDVEFGKLEGGDMSRAGMGGTREKHTGKTEFMKPLRTTRFLAGRRKAS